MINNIVHDKLSRKRCFQGVWKPSSGRGPKPEHFFFCGNYEIPLLWKFWIPLSVKPLLHVSDFPFWKLAWSDVACGWPPFPWSPVFVNINVLFSAIVRIALWTEHCASQLQLCSCNMPHGLNTVPHSCSYTHVICLTDWTLCLTVAVIRM